jgi:hypothetical protein
VDNSISAVILELENQLQCGHLSVAASSARAHLSEVASHVMRHASIGLPVLRAFKGTDVLTKPSDDLGPHGKRCRSPPRRPLPLLTSSPFVRLTQVVVTALNPQR